MKSFIALILIALFVSCSDSSGPSELKLYRPFNPLPKLDRQIGISSYENEFQLEEYVALLKESKSNFVEININWRDFESVNGLYFDKNSIFVKINELKNNGIDVALCFNLIDKTSMFIPDYISEEPISSMEFTFAFRNFASYVIGIVSSISEIKYVSIGNEVDQYINTEKDKKDFLDFYIFVVGSLKNYYPTILYGSKSNTMNYLNNVNDIFINKLVSNSDVAMFNYKPIDEKYQVLDPKSPDEHLRSLVSRINKTIYLTEVSYPSGAKYCKSSTEKQNEFIHRFFTSWDYNYEAILLVNFHSMYDLAESKLQYYNEMYDISDPAFSESIITTGLRNSDKSDKYSWKQLLREISER